jgi:adenine-specific DNA methylase
MILLPTGEKEYVAADAFDRDLYGEAAELLSKRGASYPVVGIDPGYNTNQALNYGYTHWHQMFNARQLLCLSVLADRVRAIPEPNLRDLFACLFSGVLEFNNMFASFKGEGTGAVRHMFSHHILKPERTPLEANVWGTPRSSGSFTTLFESRILRALDYSEDPSEIQVNRRNGKLASQRVFGLSVPLAHRSAKNFLEFQQGDTLYLSCGDSSSTDLADESVDAIVTDPPFFDNVHYSQLADFFYVWQRHVLGVNGSHERASTRSEAEVQQTSPVVFTDRLQRVWQECHRVLKRDGLLIFSYHHSRAEGWRAVLEALSRAGFVIVAAHPMKAEMSVAMPKHQASEPIDLDMIVVCRKRAVPVSGESPIDVRRTVEEAAIDAQTQVQRLGNAGRRLSRNDVRIVLMAQVIRRLSERPWTVELGAIVDSADGLVDQVIEQLHQSHVGSAPSVA